MNTMSSYLTGTDTYILAHRGGGGGKVPENSLQAFREAAELGCMYLETDVRLGADGKLYLAHNASSMLPNQPFATKSALPPTLEELFDALPNAFFAIDPKHALAIEPLADLIVKKGLEKRVCIGASFDGRAKRVADLTEQKSGIRPAAALVSAAANVRLLLSAAHLPIKEHAKGASFIHVHKQLVSRSVVEAAHRQSLKVITWVVNDKWTMRKVLDLGVDGFMTDYPKLAKELLGKF